MTSTKPVGVPSGNGGSLASRLVGNSLWNVAAYVAFVALTFLSVPKLLGGLGKAHYGVFVLLSSLTAPLGLLNFGFGQATIKFVAESMARRDAAAASKFVGNTLLFNLAVGVVGGGVLGILAPILARSLFKLGPSEQPLIEACLHWTAISWVLAQITGTFVAVPTAMQRFKMVALGNMIFSIGNLASAIAPVLAGHGLLMIVKVRVLWGVLAMAGWVFAARTVIPQVSVLPRFDLGAFRSSFGFGSWHTVATLGSILANQADKYLLGVYLSVEAVGLFNVPNLIFSTAYALIGRMAESAFPAISDLSGRGEHRRGVMLMLRAASGLGLLMVCVQGSLFIFAEDLLRLYVGADFAGAASHVLRIFTITAVVSAPSVVVNQYLLGVGATRWMAANAIASGLVTLLASWILIPLHGLAGAAWSDLIAIILTRPVVHYLFWRSSLRTQAGVLETFLGLYGNGVLGVPVVLLMAWCRGKVEWQPGWIAILVASASASLVIAGAVIIPSLATHHGRERFSGTLRYARRFIAERGFPYRKGPVAQGPDGPEGGRDRGHRPDAVLARDP